MAVAERVGREAEEDEDWGAEEDELEEMVEVLVTVNVFVDKLLDESLAVTVIMLLPTERAMLEIVQLVVPETEQVAPVLTEQVTEERAVLSEAVPERLTVD